MVNDIVDKTNLLDLLERLIVALRAVSDAEYISKDDQVTVDLSNYYTKSEVASGYVAKVSGKDLSTNDYTTTEKNKLAGIADNAQTNVIETVKVNNTALTPSSKAVNIDLSGYLTTSAASSTYVTKDGSKVLSTNDFTTAYKNKLDAVAENANNYTYTLPNATSSVLGGVKIGSNISVSNGTISLSSANVTSALGYTPPSSNTTYSVGTASALGLTKLYTSTGTNTDGTMTQAAINAALSNFSADVILGTTPLTVEGGVWAEWS